MQHIVLICRFASMKSNSLLLLCSLFVQLAFSQGTFPYQEPQAEDDGWKTGHIANFQADTVLLNKFLSQFAQVDHKIHGMLVIQDETLLQENYFQDYHIDRKHDLRSVTKSISALLLGIALDQGLIESIDDPISKYLESPVPKKNLDPRKDEITIRHLITMSTGLECNDWDKKSKGQEDKVYKKKDWLQYTLDLPMIHNPGDVSTYCSMGVLMMKEIISRAAGMPIDQFAEQYLFKPLGIKDIQWGHTNEKEVISSGKRLYMRPRDLAKIGLLVFHKGKWQDKQVISEAWIADMTSKHTQITGIDYGFLWWKMPLKTGKRLYEINLATGNGGQYIMIVPELDLIAIFTGGAYNSQEDKLPFKIMMDVILPVFE